MPIGQEKFLTALVNAINKSGLDAIVIEGHHNVEDCNEDVHAATVNANRYYSNGMWNYPAEPITAKEVADKFLKYVNNRKKYTD